MSSEEKEIEEQHKKRSFRPPMNTAEDFSHNRHIEESRKQKER